jgi:hypothetical protein
MMNVTLHASSKLGLDEAYKILTSHTWTNYQSGNVELPAGVAITLGIQTPSWYYQKYSWHEPISLKDGELPDYMKSWNGYEEGERKVYTTDKEHLLISIHADSVSFGVAPEELAGARLRATGSCWATGEFVDGGVKGLHLTGSKVSAIQIIDNLGKSRYCTEFKIYGKEEITLERLLVDRC